MDERNDTERLAKVIAHSGVASRREAERIISEGKVSVDGVIVQHPGHPVNARRNRIVVNGQVLPARADHVYFVLFKPRGVITGRDDPEGRPSVVQFVSHLPMRVEPVGRLDMDTEGALLFTNDGKLAHALTHPSNNVPKRYLVKVWKTPSDRQLARLAHGIRLEDGVTKAARVRVLETLDSGNAWIEVTVTEGRNRLIRRMFEAIGHPVSKLRRESFATISIQNMDRTQLRPLTHEEVQRLRDISTGTDAREAGHKTKYKAGFARPKERPNKPLSRKKAAASSRKPSQEARPGHRRQGGTDRQGAKGHAEKSGGRSGGRKR